MRTADLGMFPGLAVFVWAEFGLRGVVGVARHYGNSVADRRVVARHSVFSFAVRRVGSRRYGNLVAGRREVARHSVFSFAVRRVGSRRYGNSVAGCRVVARHSVFAIAVRRAISRRPVFSHKPKKTSRPTSSTLIK